jgi:hypothetical protein
MPQLLWWRAANACAIWVSGYPLSLDSVFPIPEPGFPISGITGCNPSFQWVLAPAHAVKEFAVVLRGFEFAEQKFGRFKLVHRIQKFSQDPYFLQYVLFQ